MCRSGGLKSCADVANDDLGHLWIEIEMRVAGRMDIALRTICGDWHFLGVDAMRAVNVTGLVLHDPGILCRVQQRRQIGMLVRHSHDDQQVGAVEQGQKARPHRHAVRILDASAEAFHLHMVATDGAGKFSEIGVGGDDAQFVGGDSRQGQPCQKQG